jgi:hypothetical protein
VVDDEPREKGGYEFFLLSLRESPGATVLREWVILSSEVIIEKDPVSGDPIRKVHAALSMTPQVNRLQSPSLVYASQKNRSTFLRSQP